MKKPVGGADLLPKKMGTEHELSISVTPRELYEEEGAPSAIDFITDVELSLIDQSQDLGYTLWQDEDGGTNQLTNGSFIFFDDYEHPIELATPECNDPLELLSYSLASREILKNCLTGVLKVDESIRAISFNERVIDSNGVTWGEHDNFSLVPDDPVTKDTDLLALHIVTRGIVSGAGYVDGFKDSICFSQKLPTVTGLYGKKWGSTALNFNGERLEVRCSDKNVSEWAHLMRLGSTALVFALIRSGFNIEKIEDYIESQVDSINAFTDCGVFAMYDELKVDPDGAVTLRPANRLALAVQKILAEESCELVDSMDDVEPIYKKIATEWLRFCEGLLKQEVDVPIDLSLFAETDWAAKLLIIQKGILRDLENGFRRSPFDIYSQATDIRYGQFTLDCPVPKEKVFSVPGLGFKLNARHPARTQIKKSQLNGATTAPPIGRAARRINMVRALQSKGLKIANVQWDSLQYDGLKRLINKPLKNKLFF